MKKNVKRWVSLFLAALMLLSMTACGSDSDDSGLIDFGGGLFTTDSSMTVGTHKNDYDDFYDDDYDYDYDYDDDNNDSGNVGGTDLAADELSDPALKYVMIYNPKVYDENKQTDNSVLNVGSLGSQIDVYANRGDGLEDTESAYTSISQLEWMKNFPDGIHLEGDRADPMGHDYKKGDKQEFYYSASGNNMQSRQKQEFVCGYAGEHCYVWAIDGKLNQADIDKMGQTFDQKIYNQVKNTFGTPRFVGSSGKVNILFYDLSTNLLGYFAPLDLFVESELAGVGLSGFTCNTGHALLNINSRYIQSEDLVCSTMAHEFQHLINFSAFFDTANEAIMNTWLNEAMSGYIEAELYSNSKELSGHYESFNRSDLIRNGQSLYNFATTYGDVGVYGSVFYFSHYLKNLAGANVFSSIMDYWRNSYSSTLSTAEALTKAVDATTFAKIDNRVDYSSFGISFANKSEEWMSKLTLDFYLSCLSNKDNISQFTNIDPENLLYDSIDGTAIEGGGRIIVALNGDTFKIPQDSDKGLIYVGLDENFRAITDFVHR